MARRLVASGWVVHLIIRPGSCVSSLSAEAAGVHRHSWDRTEGGLLQILSGVNPEIVCHVAGLSKPVCLLGEIEALMDANVTFGTLLLETMRECGVRRFVNTGTYWQHLRGESGSVSNLYAASKYAFEKIIDYYAETHFLKALTLNLYDVYGPFDQRTKLINLLINAAVEGISLNLTQGLQYLHPIHIDDVTLAYERAIAMLLDESTFQDQNSGFHQCYSVDSAGWIRVRELVDLLQRITDYKLKVNFGVLPSRGCEILESWEVKNRLPGWSPKVGLEEGLTELFQAASKNQ